MMPHLTVAYLTARKEPCKKWFIDSLLRECDHDVQGLSIVVVDYHTTKPTECYPVGMGSARAGEGIPCQRVPPKPCVYQGPNRLTKADYFAASNARNTALCYAQDGAIAFVDDLSVLMPGWLAAVRRAMQRGYVVGGAYKKVKELVVENGEPVHYVEVPGGIDSRWGIGSDHDAVPIKGDLYGCSLAAPVNVLLQVNGFDEDADLLGMGGEDTTLGWMLYHAGIECRYDLKMLTLESEERHHWEPPLKRVIEKGYGDIDASWAHINKVKGGRLIRAENKHLGKGGIAALRQKILAGEPFPIPDGPTHNWYSGKRLDCGDY